MECPHCNYADGWSNKINQSVEGTNGAFFELESHSVVRDNYRYGSYVKQERTVYACPSCFKMFIGEY